jgi:hypothetical protein
MVSDDVRLKSVFPKPPREQLCTAKFPQARARDVEDGFKRCSKSGCRMCPFTGLRHGEVQKTVMVSSTGEELPTRGKLTFNSSNLLYMVTCPKGTDLCPINQYVGETGQTGEQRCSEHRNKVVQDCHQGTTKPVGEHFQVRGHSVLDM